MGEEGTVILGATSLIGRFLTPRLAAQDGGVLAVSRNPPDLGAGGARWIACDLTGTELDALPSASLVYSLSPIWLLPQVLPTLISKGARRVVAFSSTSRFTKSASPVAAERDVAAQLAEGEDRMIAICSAAGVAWTILRPTLIYAEGQDGNISRLAALIRRFGMLPLAGGGGGLRQPVHAGDLATAALAAVQREGGRDRAYDLPGGETLTYRMMAERVFDGLGRAPRILAIPAPLWTLGFTLAKPLLPGTTAAMGARMSEDLVFDGGPARRDLGWTPRAFRPIFR